MSSYGRLFCFYKALFSFYKVLFSFPKALCSSAKTLFSFTKALCSSAKALFSFTKALCSSIKALCYLKSFRNKVGFVPKKSRKMIELETQNVLKNSPKEKHEKRIKSWKCTMG